MTIAFLVLLTLLAFNVAMALWPLPFRSHWLTLTIAVPSRPAWSWGSSCAWSLRAASCAWLALLGGLTGVDYATRREVAVVHAPAPMTGQPNPMAEAGSRGRAP